MLNKKDFFIYFKTIDKDKKITKDNNTTKGRFEILKLNILTVKSYKKLVDAEADVSKKIMILY